MDVTYTAVKKGHAAQWLEEDPILDMGDPGYETNTGRFKVGDGVHHWTELEYALNGVYGASDPLKADLVAGVVPLIQMHAGVARVVDMNAAIASAVTGLLAGAPGALDTLNELSTALGNDANFATTVTNALALKAPQSTTTHYAEGTLALRPSAAAAYATYGGPVMYFATDDNGGTLYKTATGTSWTKISPGVSETTNQLIQRFEKTDVFSMASSTLADVTGFTGMGVTGWGGDVMMNVALLLTSSLNTNRIQYNIQDDIGTLYISGTIDSPRIVGAGTWLCPRIRIPAADIPNGTTRTYKLQIASATTVATVSVTGATFDRNMIEFRRA